MRENHYYPTPPEKVNEVLDLGKLQQGMRHVDLGSGDGRVCIKAAQRGATSTGYEIDDELARKSQRLIDRLGLDAHIICADCRDADFSEADLVTGNFDEALSAEIIKRFELESKPGAQLILIVGEHICHSKSKA